MLLENIIKFIRDLYSEREAFIPLHTPVFIGNEKKYVAECIDTTFVSSVGKYVDKFEEMTAQYVGSKYAVATVNGTAALHIALLLAGVKPDEEVITQALTFVATCNAIKHANANPVFVDVDIDSMGMCPDKLENWIRNNTIRKINGSTKKDILINKLTKKRISAIVPMHTFGHPCKIDQIVEIGKKFNIPVVEDSAESLGSFYKNSHTGTFGLMGVFSYNGNKTITTGGGGMIVTNNRNIAKKAKHITTTAKIPHKWVYNHDQIAFNYRLTNLSAAVGVAQMEYINKIITNKRKTANLYKDFFYNVGINYFSEYKNASSNYWLNSIILENIKERDLFLEHLNRHEIMSRPIWRPMNQLKMYKNCQLGNLNNTNYLEERIINIPSGYRL